MNLKKIEVDWEKLQFLNKRIFGKKCNLVFYHEYIISIIHYIFILHFSPLDPHKILHTKCKNPITILLLLLLTIENGVQLNGVRIYDSQ